VHDSLIAGREATMHAAYPGPAIIIGLLGRVLQVLDHSFIHSFKNL